MAASVVAFLMRMVYWVFNIALNLVVAISIKLSTVNKDLACRATLPLVLSLIDWCTFYSRAVITVWYCTLHFDDESSNLFLFELNLAVQIFYQLSTIRRDFYLLNYVNLTENFRIGGRIIMKKSKKQNTNEKKERNGNVTVTFYRKNGKNY